MKNKTSYLVLLSLLMLTCKKDILLKDTPQCVLDRIERIKSGDRSNSPGQIVSYSYRGQLVYFISQQCCDIPSTLLDANCSIVCSPDGGFTGNGDGRCRDFFTTRTNAKLVGRTPGRRENKLYSQPNGTYITF